MHDVLVCSKGFDQHVFNVYFHSLVEYFLEHLVDEALVGFPSIFQAERHDFVAEGPSLRDEGCLLLIVWMH